MPDQRTFEARLGAALGRYADQVPTDVDAVAFVRATRARPLAPASPGVRPPRLRLALLLGLLLALAVAAALLIGGQPSPGATSGLERLDRLRREPDGPPWRWRRGVQGHLPDARGDHGPTHHRLRWRRPLPGLPEVLTGRLEARLRGG